MTRQFVIFRVRPDDLAAIEAGAAAAGIAPGQFAKAATLKAAGRPVKIRDRRKPADAEKLAAILAQLGRISGHTNQIAARLNAAPNKPDLEYLSGAVLAARRQLEEAARAIREALQN